LTCSGCPAYRDKDGVEPINDFIDGLAPERQEEVDYKINLLNRMASNDPPLPFPHSSQVDGQLRELRCHYGRDLYRILYHRSGSLFVLLLAIEKRTGALPQADIDIAKERFEDFRERMNRQPRRPPRAAGHDAPQRPTHCLPYQK
jgi:Phage-related protein